MKNSALRSAIDPVSGHTVDKALGVLLKNGTGDVLNFESEQTLRQYQPPP